MTIVTFIAAMLLIITAVLTVVLTVIAIAIVGTSHKRILSAHKITSFVDFGEAPLQYMLFFDEQILYEAVFLYMYSKKHSLAKAANMRTLKTNIEKRQRRIVKLDKLIERIYKDNVLGKIPDERFSKMMGNYEAEQKELIEFTAKAKEAIRKCTDIKELTPEIVNRLMRRIEVHKSAKIDGRKRVKLDVYFTAVRLIDIPDEKELLELMEEIRRTA